MAAGGTQRMTGDQQTRAFGESLVDRIAQGNVDEIAGPQVACTGHPGQQRDLGIAPGVERLLDRETQHAFVDTLRPVLVVVVGDVGVRVDVARHQGGVAQVDDLGIGWNGGTGADRGDPGPLHHHQTRRGEVAAASVEQVRGLEHDGLRGRRWCCFLRMSPARQQQSRAQSCDAMLHARLPDRREGRV
jgi:hypothetical protein